ncbi:MAG TPA: DJ-1/PfpI family protein [Aggregatilineales bacterium]|nr:DJ-1/PfpI family protein [Anaerolineales bacterium]HRE48425.1 DJ-1/PfpI family protein [Aggregatilineales bacterium]
MMRHVAIVIFDDVEVLDFCGPYEVFNVAAELIAPSPFQVSTVGITDAPIRTRGGMIITPTHSLATCPTPDLVIIPGGFGTRRLVGHKPLKAWIQAQHTRAEWTLSVCTGALLLADAGLITNQPATTHHTAFDRLAALSPTTRIITDQRYVQSGKIITSGGISAGIDMALHLVESLCGKDAVALVRGEMEWNWHQASL